MTDVYKGRVGVSWDAMQRHLNVNKTQALSEAEVRAVLDQLPTVYPNGRVSTQKLSETLSQWLPYVGARYGSDARQTVARTLSEFMETVSHIPSISERHRIALTISANLQTYGLNERDQLMLRLDMLNEAGLDKVVWEAEVTPQSTILVRSRLNR